MQNRYLISVATCIALIFVLCNMQFAAAAPARADLEFDVTQDTGTFEVVIQNPDGAVNNRIKALALRATVSKAAPVKIVFALSKNDRVIFTKTETAAPYCINGDANNICKIMRAGDRLGNIVLKPGAYKATISVFSAAAQAEWIGEQDITLLLPNNTDAGLPYGTGQGTIDVSIVDPHWRLSGMRQLQVEARITLPDSFVKKPVAFVKFAKFSIQSLETGDDVYVGIETGSPYCIFGELSDGKTCRSLKAGDTWPQSQRHLGDDLRKKEADTSIPRSTIKPGNYTLRINIKTEDSGEWNAFGDLILLPASSP